MSKKPTRKKLPIAVAYLRKSTKGQGRQERSLDRQKADIIFYCKGKYTIQHWYIDEGVSGWKRGKNRPQFNQMLEDADRFQAVVVGDVDRFSRADPEDVIADVSRLKAGGVKVIDSVGQGEYKIGGDIGQLIKFTIEVHGSNAFSKKLSKRVLDVHATRARQGKRAAVPPYGFLSDGEGGLKPGDPKQIKVVKRVFEEFVNQNRSMNAITSGLNADGIPTPQGGSAWRVATVKNMLKRPAYRGDTHYGTNNSGRFYQINKKGQVVTRDANEGFKGSAIVVEGTHKPLVPIGLFEKAQQRLNSFTLAGGQKSRRPRDNGHLLSRIVVCGNCQKTMYGCYPRPGKPAVYRCRTASVEGTSSCHQWFIKEDIALASLLDKVSAKLDADFLEPKPPKPSRAEKKGIEQELKVLEKQISTGEKRLLLVDDRNFKALNDQLVALRDQRDALLAKLAGPSFRKDFGEVAKFWDNLLDKDGVGIPVPKGYKTDLFTPMDPNGPHDWVFNEVSEEWEEVPTNMLVDKKALREALQTMGVQLTVWFNVDKRKYGKGFQNSYSVKRKRVTFR